jgi:anti-anti-sigma factor
VPLLNVVLVPAPDQVVVRLTGEADLSSATVLADALAQAAVLGTSVVVVDVAAATFWDCSGLHALADFTAELRRAGRQCRIVGATAATRRLVVLADFAPALVLDGPVHLPAVTSAPAPAAAVTAPTEAAPTAAPAAETVKRRRSPVPEHPAPVRRWSGGTAVGSRGAAVTLRRWR